MPSFPPLTPGIPKIVLSASTCDPDRIAALIGEGRAAQVEHDRSAGVGVEQAGA